MNLDSYVAGDKILDISPDRAHQAPSNKLSPTEVSKDLAGSPFEVKVSSQALNTNARQWPGRAYEQDDKKNIRQNTRGLGKWPTRNRARNWN